MTTGTNSRRRERSRPARVAVSGILVGRRNRMDEREARKAMLRAQIAQGDYRIDPHAVADAILRRVHMTGFDERRIDQKECSYPVRLPSASPKDTPGGPSMTHPIHVSPVLGTATSASLRALGGMHRHNS
jgi:Anti-sigma-28 factor, FlgM